MYGLISKALTYGSLPTQPQIQTVVLDKINSLPTVGKLKFGSVIYEIKHPIIVDSGKISNVQTASGKGRWSTEWKVPVVVNKEVAAIPTSASLTLDYTDYGEWEILGKKYSTYWAKRSSFNLNNISYSLYDYRLALINSTFSYTVKTGYDDFNIDEFTNDSTLGVSFDEYSFIFSNLKGKSYLDFVSYCIREANSNTPEITIIN